MTGDSVVDGQILVLGASYGGLIGARLAHAGARVTLVGRPDEVRALVRSGLTVRFPGAAGRGAVETHLPVSDDPGRPGLSALAPEDVDADRYAMAFLSMQEPQYVAPPVLDLVGRIATAGLPCVSVMNMAPLPFLARLPGLDLDQLASAYYSTAAWRLLDPAKVTLASPDPQAYRPVADDPTLLQVTLASNVKVAPFADPADQALLVTLAGAVDASTVEHEGGQVRPGVRLVARDSVFVPLAKWPMLITGNCRCIVDGPPLSIGDAVWNDPQESRELYDWVVDVIRSVGATDRDVVDFDTYAAAARSLSLPSSLARALHAGVPRVERVDQMVSRVAAGEGLSHPALDAICRRIDALVEPPG